MIGSRARVGSNPGGACRHTVSRHGATTFRVATPSPGSKECRREEAHPRLARLPNAISRVVAFRETEQNKDWRIEQMVESARTYYYKIWTKGDENMCEKLFDDNIVYRDNIWHDSDLIVGVKALRDHIRQTRQAYPDVHFVIQEVGVCSTSRLFVQWECGASNLSEFHGRRPTRHYSHTRGVDMLTFNDSREKLVEVSSFRQATKEEQLEQASHAGADGGMPEIRLVPLVYN